VVGTLKAAFVQGRLAKDEFDLRVGQALASRTYAELDAITADLPAGLTIAQPPTPARPPAQRPILRRPGLVLTAATVLYAGAWPVAFVLPTNGQGEPQDGLNLIAMATLIYLLVLLSVCAWAQGLRSQREKQSGGQLPGQSAPGAGGPVPRRLPSADPRGQLPPGDPGHRHTAQATRRRRPRPPSPALGHGAGGALAAGTAPASG
jgi:hypothetical protein